MYLDPGLGGMFIQLVVAIAAAGGAIIFFMRKKIRALFSKNKQGDAPIQKSGNFENDEDDAVDMISKDE